MTFFVELRYFDGGEQRLYSQGGSFTQFQVYPVLQLHEDGSVTIPDDYGQIHILGKNDYYVVDVSGWVPPGILTQRANEGYF